MFRRGPYAPYQGYKMEENMVGKDAWKWKDSVKASVWRKKRHVLFQTMYEHYVNVPLRVITSMGMQVEWIRDNDMKEMEEIWDNDMQNMDAMWIMKWRKWKG